MWCLAHCTGCAALPASRSRSYMPGVLAACRAPAQAPLTWQNACCHIQPLCTGQAVAKRPPLAPQHYPHAGASSRHLHPWKCTTVAPRHCMHKCCSTNHNKHHSACFLVLLNIPAYRRRPTPKHTCSNVTRVWLPACMSLARDCHRQLAQPLPCDGQLGPCLTPHM
jgi:hypothetical protein